MFGIYFPVCLRAVIARLVPERDKGKQEKYLIVFHANFLLVCLGKAFSFVALIQNLDILLGTITCIEIYRSSISFFAGLVFIISIVAKLIALALIL